MTHDRLECRSVSAASARCGRGWLLVALVVWTATGRVVVAADWAEFLGPQRNGVSSERGLLDTWPEGGPPVVWQRAVGTGYSAPSVRDGKLVLHHRTGDEEVVECFNASTGAPLWRYAYGSRFRDPYGYNNGPRCTPLLTPECCYTYGAEGKLVCLSLRDGSLLWKRDTALDFKVPEGFFGVGCTPVLEGDKLIVLVGGQPNSGVVAFDAATGATLWESVGQRTWDGVPDENGDPCQWTDAEMVVSYASPVVATMHGQRHVLCLTRQGLVSLDPADGRERFKYWFRSSVHESVNAAVPVVIDDTVMISAAYRAGSALLKVQPGGNGYDVVWRDRRNLLTHWSTAIPFDGCYFGFSGRHEQEGELRCVRAADGTVVWSTTGWEQPLDRLGQNPATGEIVDRATGQPVPWPFYGRGSAILADGKFIVLGERGTLALVRASTESFQELSRCKGAGMSNPSWTAPVLSDGRLYLRDEDSLVCLDLRRGEAR